MLLLTSLFPTFSGLLHMWTVLGFFNPVECGMLGYPVGARVVPRPAAAKLVIVMYYHHAPKILSTFPPVSTKYSAAVPAVTELILGPALSHCFWTNFNPPQIYWQGTRFCLAVPTLQRKCWELHSRVSRRMYLH